MKEQITKILSALKEKFGGDTINVTIDFLTDKLLVNGKEEPAGEFIKGKSMIQFVIGNKYGIKKIDFMELTDETVKVYYTNDGGEKLIKEL